MVEVAGREIVVEILLHGGEILLSRGKVTGLRSVASWLKAWATGLEVEAPEVEGVEPAPVLVAGCEKAACKVAKSDCAAERLPDWRSWLSFCMSCL